MAPEMAMGEAVDGRADIYALGCVAYYLLTGQLVFEGETTLQVIVKHLQSDPVPPSRRANVDIPSGLERLVLACLAKKREDRPGAGELARALGAVGLEPWTQDEAKRWWQEKGRSTSGTQPDVTNNTRTKPALDEAAGARAP